MFDFCSKQKEKRKIDSIRGKEGILIIRLRELQKRDPSISVITIFNKRREAREQRAGSIGAHI